MIRFLPLWLKKNPWYTYLHFSICCNANLTFKIISFSAMLKIAKKSFQHLKKENLIALRSTNFLAIFAMILTSRNLRKKAMEKLGLLIRIPSMFQNTPMGLAKEQREDF